MHPAELRENEHLLKKKCICKSKTTVTTTRGHKYLLLWRLRIILLTGGSKVFNSLTKFLTDKFNCCQSSRALNVICAF